LADILVSSEVTGDSSQFLADLAKDQAALDAFASYANALKIAPQVTIDSTTATNSFKQTLATMIQDAQQQGSAISMALTSQLSNVAVSLNVAGAQAQLQSLVASFQNINLTFSAPSAMQIGTDIGNAAAAAMQAAMGAAMGGMGGGGGGGGGMPGMGGGGGGSGGAASGGRSLASYLPHGFGRLLMPLMALHQAQRYFSIEEQYQEHMDDSGGDIAKQIEADIRRKKEEDSLIMGAGRIMRFAREYSLDPLTDSPSLAEEQDSLRQIKYREKNDRSEERELDYRERRRFEDRVSLGDPAEKKRAELEEKQKARKNKDDDDSRDNIKRINDEAAQRRIDARQEGKSVGVDVDEFTTSAKLLGNASAWESRGDMAEARKYRHLAATLGDDAIAEAMQRNDSQYGMTGEAKLRRDRVNAKEKADLERELKFQDYKAGEEAALSSWQASGEGDSPAQSRRKLALKLDEEAMKIENGTPEEKAAFAKRRKAEEQINENEIGIKEVEHAQKLSSIQDKADRARDTLTQGGRAVADKEYVKSLDDQIEKTEALAKTSHYAAEELVKLKGVRQQLIDAHAEQSRRAEEFEQRSSDRKVSDTQAEAAEGLQAAYGDERGSSRARLERQLQGRIGGLLDQADKVGADDPERKRLISQALAEFQAMPSKMGAFDVKEQRSDEKRLRSINESTDEMWLRTEHRGYEAGLQGITGKYDEQILQARESHAPQKIIDALQEQKSEAVKGYQASKEEKRQDMREATREQDMRTAGKNEAARSAHQDEVNRKELQEATGDPETQLDILNKQISDSHARDKGDVLHATSLRGAYDQLLGSASDPEAAKRKAHEAQLRLSAEFEKDKLAHGLDPLTGKPLQPPPKHQVDPADLNSKAAEAMTQAAKDISEAALAITGAPQIFLVGWN